MHLIKSFIPNKMQKSITPKKLLIEVSTCRNEHVNKIFFLHVD